jgi:hypothetical protein
LRSSTSNVCTQKVLGIYCIIFYIIIK